MKNNYIYRLIAGAYDLLDIVYFKNYEHSPRKAVVEAIAPNDRILDLCTGTATNAIAISQAFPSAKIVGVDLSGEMLQVARAKAAKAHIQNIELYKMDAAQMRFDAESFDKILLSLVLHEMDEHLRRKIITEAKRVLKKNGRIIITEWERSSKRHQRLLFLPIHLLEPKSYRELLTMDLSAYFKGFGLKVESCVHCDYSKVITLALDE